MELREGLAAIGVYPSSLELELWFKRYEGGRKGRLSYNDFSKAFIPFDSHYGSIVQRRPSNYRKYLSRRDECFYTETSAEFRNYWRL